MGNHETVRQMTSGQFRDLAATMIGGIPDLTFDQATIATGAKGKLVAGVRALFLELCRGRAFEFDKTQDGWELLEDCGPAILSPAGIMLVPYLNSGEDYIGGEELARRAVGLKANYGQSQAEHFLAHQEEIPVEYRKFYLVFPGTKWCDRGGGRYVPYLYWLGERWCLDFRYLDDRFFCVSGRLVRPRE